MPKEITTSTVTEWWESGSRIRQNIDNEVFQNLAFLYDEHYARFDKGIQGFQKPDPNDGRVRMTINLIKSLWRGELGRLLKGRCIPEAIPASDSDIDRNSARIDQRVLDSELDRLHFEHLRTHLYLWTTSAGFAYMHPNYDIDADNITLDVVTAGEIVRDPSARYRLNDGMWCIHGKVLTVDEAYEKFGKDFSGGEQPHRILNLANLVGGWNFGQATGSSMFEDGILVLRLWHKPSRRYPDGLILTIAGNEEVERFEEYPFDHGELPFIDFHHIKLPGRFEGQSAIRSAWGAQRNYNHSVSREAEMRALLTSPQLLAAYGQIDQERVTIDPGAILFYKQVGMHKPEPLQLGSPPEFLFKEQDQAYQQMQELFQHREVSRGEVPSSGIAASGIAMLQDADDSALGPITQGIEAGIADVGRQILALAKQYWTKDHAVRVWSEETGSHCIEYWKSDDIGSSDVRVRPGSALPRSPDQERQDILALWDRRIVTDPRLAIKYMQLPNGEGLLRVLDTATREARREHDKIYKRWTDTPLDPLSGQPQGQPIVPESWQNHQVHYAEHSDFRASEEFELWPPEAQAELDNHMAETKQMMQDSAVEDATNQAQVQAALTQPQAPPQPGQPDQGEAGTNTIPGVNAPQDQGEPQFPDFLGYAAPRPWRPGGTKVQNFR